MGSSIPFQFAPSVTSSAVNILGAVTHKTVPFRNGALGELNPHGRRTRQCYSS